MDTSNAISGSMVKSCYVKHYLHFFFFWCKCTFKSLGIQLLFGAIKHAAPNLISGKHPN